MIGATTLWSNTMTAHDSLLSSLQDARRRFLDLIDEVRPELHRYCARMTGSIADGEDVVQDTLARAYYELSELRELPALRSWLFRIAHNRALDYLGRYDRRTGEPLDGCLESADSVGFDAQCVLGRYEPVQAAGTRLLKPT